LDIYEFTEIMLLNPSFNIYIDKFECVGLIIMVLIKKPVMK